MENEKTEAENKSRVNIYTKIQHMRVKLLELNLKKTGHNRYAGFSYYTLEDITPAINKLLLKYKLVSIISFSDQIGTLTLLDIENPEEKISFQVPVREAEQKGCNNVQNLGATITYLRRYLYLIAFDIVEYDTFDAVVGRPVQQK